VTRPPVPPFTAESAAEKVRLAEDAWNTRDPAVVARDYTPDSHWRQRAEFIAGRSEIEALLARKWAHELEYRLIRELFVFGGNRIAARFAYEYHDDSGHWFRAYGIETWQFDDVGYMEQRITSVNEHMIAETQRKLLWPLGRRPDDHPTLSELGL
jgi:nuclear transport factor 2 (NTF2) superfamily protein